MNVRFCNHKPNAYDVMKTILLMNVVVFLYLFLGTESISNQRRNMMKRISDVTQPRNITDLVPAVVEPNQAIPITSSVCKRTILLFGIREHWKEFCHFRRLFRFKHLVDFPRLISCPGLDCALTLNYSTEAKDVKTADIVVFTNVYRWLTPEMWQWAHGNRSSKRQPWVMVSTDSPFYVPGFEPPPEFMQTTYNWIASYKSDSEVRLPFGYYEPFESPPSLPIDLKVFLRGKGKLLAWMGSNCDTAQWDRMRLVRDIEAQLSTDLYGKCGRSELPWDDYDKLKAILGQYKFYLSLENSCCDDYVSERFWRALDLGIVPVVAGASYEQYKRIAPPESFIHVGEFSSLTELLTRLTAIGSSDDSYLKYFQWRNKGRSIMNSQEDQYITPLKEETHCSLLQKYMSLTDSVEVEPLNYKGPRWAGSCVRCGADEDWIQNYMKPT